MRGRRVDWIVETFEAYLASYQVIDQIHQMLQRSAQSIELPDDENVAGAQVLEELRQDRPVTASAAHHLGVDLATAGFLQSVDLRGDGLILGADARVAHYLAKPLSSAVSEHGCC